MTVGTHTTCADGAENVLPRKAELQDQVEQSAWPCSYGDIALITTRQTPKM